MSALNKTGIYLPLARAIGLLIAALFLNGCVTTPKIAKAEQPSGKSYLSQFEDMTAEEIVAAGDEAWKSNELERAVFIYMQSLAVDDNPDVWMKVGKIQEHEGQSLYAWQAYERVISLEPENAAAHERLGMLYLESRQKDNAVIHLEKAVKLDETRWASNNALGVLADTSREYESAIGYYEAALEHNPQSAMLMTNMGYSFYLAGQLEEAERLFVMAIGIDREYSAAASNLGLVRARQGKYDSAVNVLENVMLRQKALNDVGYIAFKNGDVEEAERLLDEAVRTSPTYYETAHQNLTRVRTAKQNIQGEPEEPEISAVESTPVDVANRTVEISTVGEFRRVSADQLNVRRSDSMNAPIIGALRAENLVRVLENKGSWAFIKYDDGKSDRPMAGWVMSEFLATATAATP
jgi:Flp pilus assembly protein TadD